MNEEMSLAEIRRIKRLGAQRLAFNYELPIFPVVPNGKTPAIRGWRGAATRYMGQIKDWWDENPDYNIGVSAKGLLIVDVDPLGIENWRNISEGMSCPPTFTVATPRGGFHLYFRMPLDVKGIQMETGNTVSHLAPGVDVRGEGGYVVGPGSLINGKWYTITDRGQVTLGAFQTALDTAMEGTGVTATAF